MKPELTPLLEGDPRVIDGWELKGIIGVGGFGNIYLAEKNSQQVALKMIRKENLHDPMAVDRFFTEIKNLALLDHHNIAKYVGEGYASTGVPYFAIEYVEGISLERYVSLNGPIEGNKWFELAISLAETLSFCHSKGIIHKDVSPGNIVMGKSGPVLIDFGLSYLEKDPRLSTLMEVTAGTPPFMAPEQFGNERTFAMDVFSLAGTLIYAATGHYPFDGSSGKDWQESIRYEKPNFELLSDEQKQTLIPLLYKSSSQRLSLEVFIANLRNSLGYENLSTEDAKTLSAALTKSDLKLVNKKSPPEIQKFRARKNIKNLAISSLVAGLAIVLAISLLSGTDNPVTKSGTTSIASPSQTASPSKLGAVSTEPIDKEISSAKKKSSWRECEAEYDRKGTNIVKACIASANEGDVTSIYYIGVHYFSNSNYKEAAKWFLKGAKKKDLNSIRYLVETYTELSNTTERDRWAKICADTSYAQNNTSPLDDIAYCKTVHGFTLTKSGATKDGILYLTDAADYGSSEAATWLGLYYRDLDDKGNALKWLKRAAELGSKSGTDALIGYADKIGEDSLVRKWLLITAKDGNQVNMGVLAISYFWENDFASAKKWAEKGVSFGDLLSTYVLGAVTYESGDKEEGKKLLLKAANKGRIEAIRKLGEIYRMDEDNFSEAAIWYEKLADRNDFTGTAIYSALLLFLGKDQESCAYNAKVLELGNRAKENGTYSSAIMDKFMSDATSNESYCNKMYKNG